MTDCHYCEVIQNPEENPDFLMQYGTYVVLLHYDQSYLGRVVIILKDHKPSLPAVNEAEWIEFGEVIKYVQSAARQQFGAAMFNTTCLMNNAFKKDNQNPHVHWHMRPRYDQDQQVLDQTFTDPDFGNHYNRERSTHTSDMVRKEIIRKYQEWFTAATQ